MLNKCQSQLLILLLFRYHRCFVHLIEPSKPNTTDLLFFFCSYEEVHVRFNYHKFILNSFSHDIPFMRLGIYSKFIRSKFFTVRQTIFYIDRHQFRRPNTQDADSIRCSASHIDFILFLQN